MRAHVENWTSWAGPYLIWGLSHFQPKQTIGIPEEYDQITSHSTICNFISSRRHVHTSKSMQFTRIMHQRKIQRDKREMGMTQVRNKYYLLIQDGMKNQNFLLIISTGCRIVSADVLGSYDLFTIS